MTTANTKEFKQTEVGEIPADWSVAKLGDISDELFAGGDVPKTAYSDLATDEYKTPIYTNGEKNQGFYGYTNVVKVSKPSLTISGRGTIGYCVVRECPYYPAIRLIVVIPKSDIADLYYLKFALDSIDFQKHFDKSPIPQLTVPMAKQLLIPFPPKNEQVKIAKVLSKLQKVVENQEKIIADLRELKAATMSKLFREGLRGEPLKNTEIGEMPRSWRPAMLSEVCGDTGTLNPAKTPDKIIEYVDVSSVSREECRIVSSARYKGGDAPGRARNLVKHRDVIFATVRPTLRRVALIPGDLDGQLVSTAFCVIRAIEPKSYPEYLYYVVSSPGFIAQVGRLERGANYPAVTDTNVLSQKIPLPEYDEQKEIASELMKIDDALSSNNEKAKHLTDLFGVTLQRLMTGKVRVI